MPQTLQVRPTTKNQIIYRRPCSIPRGRSFTKSPAPLNQSQSRLHHNLAPRGHRFPCLGRHTTLSPNLSPQHCRRRVGSSYTLLLHPLHRSYWAHSNSSGCRGEYIAIHSIPRKLTSLMAQESMLASSTVSKAVEDLTTLRSGKRAIITSLLRPKPRGFLHHVADGNMPALPQVSDRSRSGWRIIHSSRVNLRQTIHR